MMPNNVFLGLTTHPGGGGGGQGAGEMSPTASPRRPVEPGSMGPIAGPRRPVLQRRMQPGVGGGGGGSGQPPRFGGYGGRVFE